MSGPGESIGPEGNGGSGGGGGGGGVSQIIAGPNISISPPGGTGVVTITGTGAGTGTVTSVSVTTANGFAGTVATATTTPAITISTTVTGVLKGNGTTISAAVSGTDYSAGTSALATGILKSTTTTGALTIAVAADFPTLNQNTTGTAANLSGTPALPNGTTATTQSTGDTSNDIATDLFVANAVASAPVGPSFTTSTITADPAPGVVGTYYRINYAGSGNFTLPSSPATGRWIMVKQISNHTTTFVGTIDGNASYQINQFFSVLLVFNGTSWDAN